MNEMISMRSLVGVTLNEMFGEHPNMFVIDSDLAHSTTTDTFQEAHPKRFVETGIAEQNAMSIAAGIAVEGGLPFYVNFAIFATGTCWTQLRQACYANLNVKVISTHPGMDGGYDGATHHALEDLALTRAIPNLMILVPSNPDELRDAVRQACDHVGPVYVRVARDDVPNVPEAAPAQAGKATVVEDQGDDFAVIFEGSAATAALGGYELAKERGLRGKLINAYSLKPFDEDLVSRVAGSVKRIVTVENHSVINGLGAAVAKTVCGLARHAPVSMVGVNDTFTESGPAFALKQKYGVCPEKVLEKIEA